MPGTLMLSSYDLKFICKKNAYFLLPHGLVMSSYVNGKMFFCRGFFFHLENYQNLPLQLINLIAVLLIILLKYFISKLN